MGKRPQADKEEVQCDGCGAISVVAVPYLSGELFGPKKLEKYSIQWHGSLGRSKGSTYSVLLEHLVVKER